MEVRRHKYVKLIKGTYKYVREYPEDVLPYAPTRYFIQTLNSKSLKEAERCYSKVHEECERLIEHHRLHKYKIPDAMRIAIVAELESHYLLTKGREDIALPDLLEVRETIIHRLISLNARIQIEGGNIRMFSPVAKGYVLAFDIKQQYHHLLFQLEKIRRYAMQEAPIAESTFEQELTKQLSSISHTETIDDIAVSIPMPSKKQQAQLHTSPRLLDAYTIWLGAATDSPWGHCHAT